MEFLAGLCFGSDNFSSVLVAPQMVEIRHKHSKYLFGESEIRLKILQSKQLQINHLERH